MPPTASGDHVLSPTWGGAMHSPAQKPVVESTLRAVLGQRQDHVGEAEPERDTHAERHHQCLVDEPHWNEQATLVTHSHDFFHIQASGTNITYLDRSQFYLP